MDDVKKKILYISYDGMTDPLGQSQVLPYLVGLSKYGYQFTILSFEKEDRLEKLKSTIDAITKAAGITWVPMSFTVKPPILSKLYDVIRMRRKAIALYKEHRFDMTHCRSYIAASLGLVLKRKYGVRFFFDMRGFWADEKKDAGSWKQDSFIFRNVYQHYKKKEAEYINQADYIISLTEAGKREMMTWPSFNPDTPLSVIPCCADMDHFSLATTADKEKGRLLLGLPADKLVVSYLGSIGAWYMLDEMLHLFSLIKQRYPGAVFLFITHSSSEQILSKLATYQLSKEDMIIMEASRKEVPVYIKASDINISFIKPVYSKLSSSPTKLGEVLAMGIPVIVNSGVGDVETIVNDTAAGFVLQSFTEEEYTRAVNAIDGMLQLPGASIREKAEKIYSLTKGIEEYRRCYASVFAQVQ